MRIYAYAYPHMGIGTVILVCILSFVSMHTRVYDCTHASDYKPPSFYGGRHSPKRAIQRAYTRAHVVYVHVCVYVQVYVCAYARARARMCLYVSV